MTTKKTHHVISTHFHGKGLISSHKNEELAEAAASRWRGSECSCGCCAVFTTEEALALPDDNPGQQMCTEMTIYPSDRKKLLR